MTQQERFYHIDQQKWEATFQRPDEAVNSGIACWAQSVGSVDLNLSLQIFAGQISFLTQFPAAPPSLTHRGSYGGDVVGLQVEDDVLYSLDPFFCGEVHLVVFAADVSGDLMNTNC